MKPICASYRKGEELKRFLSYEDDISLLIHVIAYDKDVHHYGLFPRITLIPLLGKRKIDFRLGCTGVIGLLLLIILIISIIVTFHTGRQVLWMVIDVLLIVASYTFLQLHFIDLKLIRVFETVLDNGTYRNLSNMDLNNPSNRIHEIYLFPEVAEKWILPFRVPLITSCFSYCRYVIYLVKHDVAIQKYLKHKYSGISEIKPIRIKDEIDRRLGFVYKSIEQLGLKIYDVVIMEKEASVSLKK